MKKSNYTLAELAATKNLYQVNDIPVKYRGDDDNFHWRTRDSKEPNQLVNQLNHIRGIECGIFYYCTQDTGHKGDVSYYIEPNSRILVKSDSLDLLLRVQHYKGKMSLYIDWSEMTRFNKLHYTVRDAVKLGLKEPNQIGVITAKKVLDWIEYCRALFSAMCEILAETNDKNAQIVAQVDGYVKRLGGTVKKWENTTRIDVKGFRIGFKHDPENSYLQTSIDFEGNINDVLKLLQK